MNGKVPLPASISDTQTSQHTSIQTQAMFCRYSTQQTFWQLHNSSFLCHPLTTNHWPLTAPQDQAVTGFLQEKVWLHSVDSWRRRLVVDLSVFPALPCLLLLPRSCVQSAHCQDFSHFKPSTVGNSSKRVIRSRSPMQCREVWEAEGILTSFSQTF